MRKFWGVMKEKNPRLELKGTARDAEAQLNNLENWALISVYTSAMGYGGLRREGPITRPRPCVGLSEKDRT